MNIEQQDPFSQLTPREIEIIKDIADGLSSKDIANKRSISFFTAEAHRHSLLKKMKRKGFLNSAHVVAGCLRAGVIQ